jgi:hypothetical protein
VVSSLYIIKGINYNVEPFKEFVAEVFLLNAPNITPYVYLRVLFSNCIAKTIGLWLPNIFSTKQELSVQIADVNRVQVNNFNVLKACHTQAFDKFTSDATSTHNQNLSTGNLLCNISTV